MATVSSVAKPAVAASIVVIDADDAADAVPTSATAVAVEVEASATFSTADEASFAAEAVFVYGLSNASANLESSNSFDANFLLILDFLNNLLTSAISSNSFIADSNPFLLEDLSPPEKAFINTSDILLPSIDFPIFLYSGVL